MQPGESHLCHHKRNTENELRAFRFVVALSGTKIAFAAMGMSTCSAEDRDPRRVA